MSKMEVTGLRDSRVRVLSFFARTSTSFKGRPFLYNTIGHSLNISFIISNGWLSIECHSFIRICFKLGTDG